MDVIFSKNAFQGRHVVIIGGCGDIGMEIARQFQAAGASKIALVDINTELAKGSSFIPIQTDLSKVESIEEAVQDLYKISDKWHILVTTAGIFIGKTLLDCEANEWDSLMEINARAVFYFSKLIAKSMVQRKEGKIIHIGSGSTYYGTPGSGVYSASKVVINQLTQTMAVEWGPSNVQVNAVLPTVTETKFLEFVTKDPLHSKFRKKLKEKMPMGELLQPEDIAPLVLFLASKSANAINGAIIPIDGGSRLVST